MESNNKLNLTFSDFLSFKPMAFAKTWLDEGLLKLKSVQVAIPVPNSSFCIAKEPKMVVKKDKGRIILKVEVDGEGDDRKAGQMLYFSMRPLGELAEFDQRNFDLIVKVNSKDTRPQLGKSVVKIVDEEAE